MKIETVSSIVSIALASSAFAALTPIEINETNVSDYAQLQNASWIGGIAYGIDFGNGYGPNNYNSGNKVYIADGKGNEVLYSVSTSTLAQGFTVEGAEGTQYVKKMTFGGNDYANQVLLVDADYEFNVLFYQSPQYKNSEGVNVEKTTVSSSGEVYGAAMRFQAESDGSFHTLSAVSQNIQATGSALILDFSKTNAESGQSTLLTWNNGSKYSGKNSLYYTLDGENFVECISGDWTMFNNYRYESEDGNVVFDFKTDTLDSVTSFGVSYTVSQVPEPSTYAAIFGALALAFVAYKKRRA